MGKARSPAAWVAATAFGMALLIGLALFAPTRPLQAQDGDAAVAAALLKSGKASLRKKQYQEAITFFDKALAEHDSVIEAHFQKAFAFEKLARPKDALASYRSFVELCRAKDAAASKEELALLKRATKRVDALAAGERELRKLEDRFVADVLGFAKKHADKDPHVSIRALRAALAARPDHEDARDLLEELGGDVDPGAEDDGTGGSGPFAKLDVAEWIDFVGLQAFPSKRRAVYEDGVARLEVEGGVIMDFPEARDDAGRFVLEMEYRVTAEHERGWAVGWTFGGRDGGFYGAFAQRSSIDFVQNHAGGARNQLGDHPMRPIALDSWHRLDVKVEGATMEVWYDGKRVFRDTDDDRSHLKGDVGIFHQRCTAEYRVARMGILE